MRESTDSRGSLYLVVKAAHASVLSISAPSASASGSTTAVSMILSRPSLSRESRRKGPPAPRIGAGRKIHAEIAADQPVEGMAALGIQQVVHELDVLKPAAQFDSGGCERVHHGFQTGSALVTAASSSSVLNSSGAPSAHLPSAATYSFPPSRFRAILPAAISAGLTICGSGRSFPLRGRVPGLRRSGGELQQKTLERREFIFVHQSLQLAGAYRRDAHVVGADVERYVRLYRDQLARERYMALGGPEQLLLARGKLADMLVYAFDARILRQQLGGADRATPCTPGTLSEESPQSVSMSMTCSGEDIFHLAQTSASPSSSLSAPDLPGRYCHICGATSWP